MSVYVWVSVLAASPPGPRCAPGDITLHGCLLSLCLLLSCVNTSIPEGGTVVITNYVRICLVSGTVLGAVIQSETGLQVFLIHGLWSDGGILIHAMNSVECSGRMCCNINGSMLAERNDEKPRQSKAGSALVPTF